MVLYVLNTRLAYSVKLKSLCAYAVSYSIPLKSGNCFKKRAVALHEVVVSNRPLHIPAPCKEHNSMIQSYLQGCGRSHLCAHAIDAFQRGTVRNWAQRWKMLGRTCRRGVLMLLDAVKKATGTHFIRR